MRRETYDSIISLLRMRGAVIGNERAERVFRIFERADPSWAQLFDALRSAGAEIPFSVERGVIRTLRAHQAAQAERNAREIDALRKRRTRWDDDNTGRLDPTWKPRRITRGSTHAA